MLIFLYKVAKYKWEYGGDKSFLTHYKYEILPISNHSQCHILMMKI